MTMIFAPVEGVDMGEVESALDRLAELAQQRRGGAL